MDVSWIVRFSAHTLPGSSLWIPSDQSAIRVEPEFRGRVEQFQERQPRRSTTAVQIERGHRTELRKWKTVSPWGCGNPYPGQSMRLA
jgi:hypothetical protein